MSHYLETCGRKIDVVKQQIIFNGEVKQVRPKAFQLLLQFLDKPQKLIEKSQLLEQVWDDVEVSEQVLFQTIRELRNLFAGEDVISTQPRKGYVWVAPVRSSTIIEKQAADSEFIFPLRPKFVAVFSAVFVLLLAYFFPWQSSEKLDGSLVVLPVKSELPDNNHNWVYLGAMHQLISHFSSDNNLVVLPPEHVLNVMRKAELPRLYNAEQLSRIFAVSGANLIVEATLSGSVKDYNLKYKLHFRNDVKRGIVFGDTVNNAIDELAKVLTKYTGQKLNRADHSNGSEFANELMARAIEQRAAGNYQESNDLLSGLLTVERNNVLAHRVMATNYLALKALDKAKRSLNIAESLATSIDSEELPIIYYYKAVAAFIENDLNKTLELLDLADEKATELNNWLYRAFVSGLKGKIYMNTGKLALAKGSFNDALSHHSVIQCPVGKSQSLLSLSRVAKLSGNDLQALDYLSQAEQIIKQRALTFIQRDFDFVKQKVI